MLGQFHGHGETDRRFTWIEQIDNGFLVHYRAPVKQHIKLSEMRPSFPGAPYGEESKDAISYHSVIRTFYCKDGSGIAETLKVALKAQEEYLTLEKDGKMNTLLGGGSTVA